MPVEQVSQPEEYGFGSVSALQDLDVQLAQAAACDDVATSVVRLASASPVPAGTEAFPVIILEIIAQVIAGLVTNCLQSKIAGYLRRIKQHPNGIVAVVARKKIAKMLPDSVGQWRSALTQALLTTGVELVDQGDKWMALFPSNQRG